MARIIGRGFSFDDVLIVPKYNKVFSRKDVSLKTKVTRNHWIDIPLLATNMDTICESKMAIALGKLGGLGVIHRFLTIEEQSKECLASLESKYKKAGYSASISEGNTSVELLPKRIAVTFNNKIILAKENTETYDKISIIINNNLYERIGIANSIIEWETRLGEAETTLYMNYYHDLKVEKKKQSDGTKIYIITDRNTGDIFQLASRSIVWPSGYGMEGTY